ncbi:MAG: HlyD family efflux transporter periplasmic adaptor subunit, partial [Candidatus Baltobacteraceae bacterium]
RAPLARNGRVARAAADSAQAQFANASGVTLPKTTAAALAAYRAAQAQYDALAAGPRPNQIRQLESNERASQGALVQARHQFDETIVRAPASGVVSAMDLHPGDLVGAGSSVATIEESGNPYVRIYVPQPELKDFAVGTKVAVHSDALPGVTFDGVVENVDARAQFTPQNVQTEDGRAGLTFGVKIRIADKDHRLQDGTTAGVSLL